MIVLCVSYKSDVSFILVDFIIVNMFLFCSVVFFRSYKNYSY